MGLAPPRPLLAGRGAAAGVYHTPEGSPPGGLSGPEAWVLHMPAVGLVVDDRGRMKQSVLTYPWEAARSEGDDVPWDLRSGTALISSMLSWAVLLPAVDDMVLRRIRAGGSDPSTATRTARDWRGRSSAVLRGALAAGR